MEPRYLNRRFESVPDEAQAAFSETVHESRLDLRYSERDLSHAVAVHHFTRSHSNEARFSPAYSEDMLQVGDLIFTPAGSGMMAARSSAGTEIVVGTTLFKADAEATLSVLAAHESALRQTGVVSITIGVTDDPKHKGKRIGVCYPATGRVTFFCDEHGGLLAKGIADVTTGDPVPVDFERAVLHELAHLMEHDPKCNTFVEEIVDDITRFLLADSSSPKQLPKPWLHAAKAINAEYLPTRFNAVLGNITGPTREREVRMMAHEFLAELIPAVAWQDKDLHFEPDCPASIKGLYDYVCQAGKSFSVADKIKKLSTRTIHTEKDRALVHSDFIEDHGGPELM